MEDDEDDDTIHRARVHDGGGETIARSAVELVRGCPRANDALLLQTTRDVCLRKTDAASRNAQQFTIFAPVPIASVDDGPLSDVK